MTLKNTENNVIIHIKNLQSDVERKEETELITEGRFYESNNKFYIFYSEEESEETSACSVMIVVSEKDVTITRKGEFSSKMHYVKGKTEQITYHTPYGNMSFVLKTSDIINCLTEHGGELKLIYKLSVNGEIINNDLTVTVKKGKGE